MCLSSKISSDHIAALSANITIYAQNGHLANCLLVFIFGFGIGMFGTSLSVLYVWLYLSFNAQGNEQKFSIKLVLSFANLLSSFHDCCVKSKSKKDVKTDLMNRPWNTNYFDLLFQCSFQIAHHKTITSLDSLLWTVFAFPFLFFFFFFLYFKWCKKCLLLVESKKKRFINWKQIQFWFIEIKPKETYQIPVKKNAFAVH